MGVVRKKERGVKITDGIIVVVSLCWIAEGLLILFSLLSYLFYFPIF